MRQQGIGRKNNSCHGVLLIRIQLDRFGHRWKIQKRSVKNTPAHTAEFVFKYDLKALFSRIVCPYPFLKCSNELLLLFNDSNRFSLIYNPLFAGRICRTVYFLRNRNGFIFRVFSRICSASSFSVPYVRLTPTLWLYRDLWGISHVPVISS